MSLESEADKLCHKWIVEYDCWRVWCEFSKSGTVDDAVKNRTVWRSSQYSENCGDRKTHDYRLLIHFMCKTAEGGKELSIENQNDVTPGQLPTAFEEAIDLLDYISNSFTRQVDGEVREVKLCLRRFAVLAPLHKDDRTTAKVLICLLIFSVRLQSNHMYCELVAAFFCRA